MTCPEWAFQRQKQVVAARIWRQGLMDPGRRFRSENILELEVTIVT